MPDGFQTVRTANALTRLFADQLSPHARAMVHQALNPVGAGKQAEDIPHLCQLLHLAFALPPERLFEPLGALRGLSPRTLECAIAGGLIGLARYHPRWVRPAETFRPADTATPIIGQLARHLLVKFQMPVFMDSVWAALPRPFPPARSAQFLTSERPSPQKQLLSDSDWIHVRNFRDWYADIGAGLPVDCPSAPAEIRALTSSYNYAKHKVPMPRPHHIMQAPGHFRLPWDWIRLAGWSEILRADAPLDLANRIVNTKIGTLIVGMGADLVRRRPLFASLVRFLSRYPDFPDDQIDPVCDYFLRSDRVLRNNPSLRNVTPASLLRDIATWHCDLAEEARLAEERAAERARELNALYPGRSQPIPFEAEFQPCGRRGLTLGEPQMDAFRPAPCWVLFELLSAKELREEGAALGHCVSSYARGCYSRQISIWSLRRAAPGGGLQRRLTIELTADGTLVQARGLRNRMPLWSEYAILKAWAKSEGLKLAQRPPPPAPAASALDAARAPVQAAPAFFGGEPCAPPAPSSPSSFSRRPPPAAPSRWTRPRAAPPRPCTPNSSSAGMTT
jgi:hypothetical protein